MYDSLKALKNNGNYLQAIEVGKKTLYEISVDPTRDNQSTGRVFYYLGYCYDNIHKYDSAEYMFKNAFDIYLKEFGEENYSITSILNYLGEVCQKQGKDKIAERYYSKALEIRNILLLKKDEKCTIDKIAELKENLALLYMKTEKYSEAELLFVEARSIYQSEKISNKLVVNSRHLGMLYTSTDRYDIAEKILQSTIEETKKAFGEYDEEYALSLTDYANLLRSICRYSDAQKQYEEVIKIRKSNESKKLHESLHNLGLNYYDQGEYAEADYLLNKALKEAVFVFGDSSLMVSTYHTSIGNLYFDLNNYEKANFHLVKALEIEKLHKKQTLSLANCFNNLGFLYLHMNRLKEAESYIKSSLKIIERYSGSTLSDKANILETAAQLYIKKHDYRSAEKALIESISLLSKLFHNHPLIANAKSALSRVYCKNNDIEEALELQMDAFTYLLDLYGADHYYTIKSCENLSQIYRKNTNLKEAIKYSIEAISSIYRIFQKNNYILTEQESLKYASYLRTYIDRLITICYDNNSSMENNNIASLIISSKGLVTFLTSKRKKYTNSITETNIVTTLKKYRLKKKELTSLVYNLSLNNHDSMKEELNIINRELEELKETITKLYPKLEDENFVVSIKNLKADINDNDLVLDFIKYDYYHLGLDVITPRYLVVGIDCDKTFLVYLGDANSIDCLIESYRNHIQDISTQGHLPTEENKNQYDLIAKAIYEKVLFPLEKHIREKTTVLLSPDADLNFVSFAGLLNRNNKYIIESYNIQYFTSIRNLVIQKNNISGVGLLAIGDPDFDNVDVKCNSESMNKVYGKINDSLFEVKSILWDNKNYSLLRSGSLKNDLKSIKPLPGTKEEINKISAEWKLNNHEKSIIFTGKNASKSCFRKHSSGKKIIHIATHGFFIKNPNQSNLEYDIIRLENKIRYNNPLMYSGLIFAGVNSTKPDSNNLTDNEGLLTAEEITELNLSGVDLVTLSACETGIGDLTNGEGLYGLSRAFHLAGAKTVISSLWKVSDKYTAEIMSQLYTTPSKSFAIRIRDIQLSLINKIREDGNIDHPYNWAAFITTIN